MRAARCLVAMVVLALARPSHATTNAAAAQAGVVAGIAANNGNPPVTFDRALQGWGPIEGWVDPLTGASGRLNVGCGAASELLLSSRGTTNHVDLVLTNESSATLVFAPTAVVARFSSGLTRRLLPDESAEITLLPEWTAHVKLTFPAKGDFQRQDWVEIELAFVDDDGAACTTTTRLDRDTRLPPSPSSYVAHSILELQFSVGARFATTGDLAAVASPVGSAVDFGFAWYPRYRYGFLLDLVLDNYGARGAALVAPQLTLAHPRISGAGLFVGASLRAYPFSWLSVAYQPTPGIYALELIDGPDSGSKETSGLFVLRERLRLAVGSFKVLPGMDLWITGSLVHLYLPYGTMGDVPVSGNAFSALLSLVLGG